MRITKHRHRHPAGSWCFAVAAAPLEQMQGGGERAVISAACAANHAHKHTTSALEKRCRKHTLRQQGSMGKSSKGGYLGRCCWLTPCCCMAHAWWERVEVGRGLASAPETKRGEGNHDQPGQRVAHHHHKPACLAPGLLPRTVAESEEGSVPAASISMLA